tara:strand:- start:53 stop:304 length:252 start_codon:yes stop_codon:yes gene_type:complete
MKAALEAFFDTKTHNTNIQTEIVAGITTFITMAYIVFVNPQMMLNREWIMELFLLGLVWQRHLHAYSWVYMPIGLWDWHLAWD